MRNVTIVSYLSKIEINFYYYTLTLIMNKPHLPSFLQNIIVVLSRTSHPANIGSAARAMKTMGLTQLVLVSPKLIATPMTATPPVFDPEHVDQFHLPEESFILASGARDVLENVRITPSLDEAIAPCSIACALTSRKRELTAPLQTPREITPEILKLAQSGQKVALVFGNETSGLAIDEAILCNRLITINGNPDYFSLNLSQAVQVISYEIMSQIELSMAHLTSETELATRTQVAGMVEHMGELMQTIGFFERRNRERLLAHMHNLFGRTPITKEDIDILRGFFKTAENKINKP